MQFERTTQWGRGWCNPARSGRVEVPRRTSYFAVGMAALRPTSGSIEAPWTTSNRPTKGGVGFSRGNFIVAVRNLNVTLFRNASGRIERFRLAIAAEVRKF